MSRKTSKHRTTQRTWKIDLILVCLAALTLGYLGLMISLRTASPFMLVHGGSMEPTIHAGDLLLNKNVPATGIRVGDVIAFDTPKKERQQKNLPATLAHRVMSIEGKAGELVFITKGDNSDTDRSPVPASAVNGVMVKNLGVFGRPFMLLTNTRVLIMVGLPVAAFLVVGGLVSMMDRGSGQRSRAATVRRRSSPANDRALGRLPEAIGEYGTHLKSHTRVMVNLAATAEDLHSAVEEQRRAYSAMAQLQSVVRRHKAASDELRQAVIEQDSTSEGLDAVVDRATVELSEAPRETNKKGRPSARRSRASSGETDSGRPGARAA